ncbi:asparaginase domain-containing protein [Saprospira sp. CCB-QB6]|uniref:asparaginase domain-containing protein n=1 Tax=Saprospira sp. CCB-QB6 TaxID=3023936 RepID=UPI00234BE3C3|nr:asparaginase domain-containing protein [Saprospira sp. CCB-QB6]WCL80490.1 asparaginase domain-containing protein [Saprospira sp. CCB-QB6]
MKKNNSILALVTGGTFDKEYDMITGKLFFKDTHLPEIFKRGRSTLDIKVRTLMMVDSLDMNELDRDIIIKHCQSTDETRILITHGTDTMEVTAAAIAKAGKIEGKTIVLLGAMIPYTFGMSSDGFFNLGSALAFVQTLPPGVYIAMHGEYFNWDNVRKNRSTGYFETTKDKKY